MQENKIGIALAGGGSKGAYQIGVFKALIEENLIDKIEVSSGTSIGAINTLLLMSNLSYNDMIRFWNDFSDKDIYKKDLSFFKNERKSLIKVNPFIKHLENYFTRENIKQSKLKGYATVSKIKKPNLRNQINLLSTTKETFCLNETEDPFKATLASASVPIIYGATEIDNNIYVDGGLTDNLPFEPILNEKCNIIFSIPLSNKFDISLIKDKKLLIIDFLDPDIFNPIKFNVIRNVLNFDKKMVDKLILDGYEYSKKMIKYLKDKQILNEDNSFNYDERKYTYINYEVFKND